MSRKTSYIVAFVLLAVTLLSFVYCGAVSEPDSVKDFLEGYGWQCEALPIEKEEIIIPNPFDEVYKNYNNIQLEAGLNLEPYSGEKCTRYTYIITNYPKKTEEEVRANVIVCKGKCIGGDICTVSLYGFMHSLIYP